MAEKRGVPRKCRHCDNWSKVDLPSEQCNNTHWKTDPATQDEPNVADVFLFDDLEEKEIESVAIITGPDFGCIHWEPRKKRSKSR